MKSKSRHTELYPQQEGTSSDTVNCHPKCISSRPQPHPPADLQRFLDKNGWILNKQRNSKLCLCLAIPEGFTRGWANFSFKIDRAIKVTWIYPLPCHSNYQIVICTSETGYCIFSPWAEPQNIIHSQKNWNNVDYLGSGGRWNSENHLYSKPAPLDNRALRFCPPPSEPCTEILHWNFAPPPTAWTQSLICTLIPHVKAGHFRDYSLRLSTFS